MPIAIMPPAPWTRLVLNGIIDTDASTTPPIDVSLADRLSIGGTCKQASGSIDFIIVYDDGFNNVVGTTGKYTLASGSKANWGTAFLGIPNDQYQAQPIPATAMRAFVYVTAVKNDWTLNAFWSYPPGISKPA